MRRGLRPHRTHTKRWTAVVLALATVGALAVTGLALAAAGSSVNFSFQPSNPHGTATSGRLAFGTHTNYTGSHRDEGDTPPVRRRRPVQPELPPEVRPGGHLGQHHHAGGVAGVRAGRRGRKQRLVVALERGLQQRQRAVQPRQRDPHRLRAGVQRHGLNGRGPDVRSDKVEGVGPIDCGGPTTNTDGDPAILVQGDLKANPAIGADFTDPDNCSAPDPRRGCQIDLTNVSDGPIRLVHLATQIGRLSYVRAKCVDPPAGNRQWNLRQSSPPRIPPVRQDADGDRFADLHLARS